jgi:hypothetical protein
MTAAFNLSQLANNLNSSGRLDATDGLVGNVPIGNGGTGISGTPTNGQLLIGNGSGYTLATISAGTNITISNTAGGITISSAANAPIYSPEFAYPATNVATTWNHGLGSRPRRFGAVVVLTVETNGTPVGTAFTISTSDGDGGRQFGIYANSTVVGYFGSYIELRGLNGSNFSANSSICNIYFWAEK